MYQTGPRQILDALRARMANRPNRASQDQAPDPDTLLAQGPTKDGDAANDGKAGKGDDKTTTTNAANSGGGKAANKAKPPKPKKPRKTLARITPEMTWTDANGKVRKYGDLGTELHELGEAGPNGGYPPAWYIEKYKSRMLRRFAQGEFVRRPGGKEKRISGFELRWDFNAKWEDADTVEKKLHVVRQFIWQYEQAEKQLKKRRIRLGKFFGQDNVKQTLKKLRWLEKNIADASDHGIDDLHFYLPGG